MAYFTRVELEQFGFAALGQNVKISDKTSIYGAEQIEIGDNSRIDDFCVVSGNIKIGRNVYIGPGALIAGGLPGIVFEDFVTLAYHVMVFTQSDDYSGRTMTNPTVPARYKIEIKEPVHLERHCILGAGSIVMPGVTLSEGTSLGAGTLVSRSTEPWGIYVGSPARRLRDRYRDLLELERRYLAEEGAAKR